MEEVKAIQNILQVLEPNTGNVVVMTSFDGGFPGEDTFEENYKETLQKVVTPAEYEYYREKKISYIPHMVKSIAEVPENFKTFVESDLKQFGEDGARTIVLFRFFENTEDGFIPVEVDSEGELVSNSLSQFQENTEA